MHFIASLLLMITIRSIEPMKWGPSRLDGRCGLVHMADCDASGPHPCCSPSGWCGKSENHCTCGDCVDFRKTSARKIVGGKLRHLPRCRG